MITTHTPPRCQFNAIIFDCDGVLVDSEAIGLDDAEIYLRRHGFAWSKEELIARFSGLRDDQFFKLLSETFADIHGKTPPDGFFKGLYDQRANSPDPMRAIDGAHNALEQITLPLAVASSSRTNALTHKLEITALSSFFNAHIYSADLVEHGKPDPAIYRYAADKLAINAGDCLVIEDSVNGVRSGLSAGMTVWGFTGGSHCFDGHAQRLLDAGAHWVAPDFSAITSGLC